VKAYEKILIYYFSLLSVLIVLFANPFSNEYIYLVVNAFFIVVIIVVKKVNNDYFNPITTFIRYWLPILLFTFLYKEIKPLLHIVTSTWFDDIFANLDVSIFGTNLGLWVEQFDHPLLNEIFRLGYVSYYFIIVIGSAMHYFYGKLDNYEKMLAQITAAFCISYLMFIFLPTQGPRFFHAQLFNSNMDGLLISQFQMKIIEVAAFRGGAFPSSHIAVAVIIWFSFYKANRKFFHILNPFVILLIFGTIWGRYHYAVDAIAGIILALLIYWGYPRLISTDTTEKALS
jgi:hypothetical protein